MDKKSDNIAIPTVSSSFTPLPQKEKSFIEKKIISKKSKPSFFISSSEEELFPSVYASPSKTSSPSPSSPHLLPSPPCSPRTPCSPWSRRSRNSSFAPEQLNWSRWRTRRSSISNSDEDIPGLCSAKPSPPPDYSRQPSPSSSPNSKTLPNKSDHPKLFSSSAFINIKPVKKPEPQQAKNNFNSDDQTFETIVKSTYTTRVISSPKAITTTHEATTTRTIIRPKKNEQHQQKDV